MAVIQEAEGQAAITNAFKEASNSQTACLFSAGLFLKKPIFYTMLNNPWFYAFIVVYVFAGFLLLVLNDDDKGQSVGLLKDKHTYGILFFWPLYVIMSLLFKK